MHHAANLTVTELVIVCCHGIFLYNHENTNADPPANPYCEANWLLQSFQRSTPSRPGEHETFVLHVQAALNVLQHSDRGSRTLVVFSGGATARSQTALSEARSYLAVAEYLQNDRATREQLRERIVLEEKATDSYQNLLFSIIEFRRRVGRYPDNIVVITHAFKAQRFLELHAKAIKWPIDRIRVQGIDPVQSYSERAKTLAGEAESGYGLWKNDPYGTSLSVREKRNRRGWTDASLCKLEETVEGNVKRLLHWTDGSAVTNVFPDPLPWEELVNSSDVA